MNDEIVVSCSELPAGDTTFIEFRDTAFFKNHGSTRMLPTPEEVRTKANGHWRGGKPAPVVFRDLGLLVKFGPLVTTAEAQCLWLINKHLKDQVHVPEVYGWKIESDGVFIYMQFIEGIDLHRRWDEFNEAERSDVCLQLRKMMLALRRLKQDPHDTFIGELKNLYILSSYRPLTLSRRYRPPTTSILWV
jgi:hypothetical protein